MAASGYGHCHPVVELECGGHLYQPFPCHLVISYMTVYPFVCIHIPGRYMSNAIGFPCKLNCVLSSYITYESHAFCSGNSYLNAIPSSNALTIRFTVLSFPFLSHQGHCHLVAVVSCSADLPTTSSWPRLFSSFVPFPALSPAPELPAVELESQP